MIELKDLRDEDSQNLFLWRRDPAVSAWMCGRPAETFEEHQAWFDAFRDDRDSWGWIIALRSRPVGFLTLKLTSAEDRRADWGWYIGERGARGLGVGGAAQALGLDRAFDELGLEKVTSEVLVDNAAALKVQLSAGFRREGLLRAHALKDGARRDIVLLGLLGEEWRARRVQYRQGLAKAWKAAA